MTELFEMASRTKLRFKVASGVISTEDLWDLSLESLNTIARTINKEIKNIEESFIEERTTADKRVALMFDVVKYIIQVKLDERKAAKERAAKMVRKSELLEILNEKENADLRAKTKEELLKELEELG